MLRCSKCKEVKPSTEFAKNNSKARGYHSYCRPCVVINTREWREKNPEKAEQTRKNNARLQRFNKYGITKARFDELMVEQDGVCAICRNEFKNDKDTHIDHCHDSMRVRGILCGQCNNGLGNFKDSVPNLRAAIDYLQSVPR